jgi:CubicO group peptidase (beta-lactamase class C family)
MTDRRQFLKQAGTGLIGAGLIATFPHCSRVQPVATSLAFPRCTPEQQGIASAGIRAFLQAVADSGIEFHSIMMLRRGHVVAEGWWAPYAPALKHTLYSLSKSFTSTAVGMAVADGKLTIDDPVLSFFPEYAPDEVSENLAAMQVRHLLTMTTGHAQDTTASLRAAEDGRWPRAFLALEVEHEPGTHFLYNTGATYMLSAIVQKVTGQTLMAFLTERLFRPLEIEGADWETDPRGVNTGGYGLRVKTEDIAKLGQLYLQKGRWGDQQLLPESWVEAATKKQTPSQEGDNDWSQGYGYQFWRCKPEPGFYRGDGAFGQYCIVIPQHEVVIAITSESFDMQASMNLVWEHLLPAISQEVVAPEDAGQADLLAKELRGLTIPPPTLAGEAPAAALYSGKTFQLEENPWNAKSLRFGFAQDECTFTLQDEKGEYPVICGLNRWHTAGNEKTDPDALFAVPGRTRVRSKMAASATWQDEKTLLMTWRWIENAHHDQLTCVFEDDQVSISFLGSVAAGRKQADDRSTLRGSVVG